jgi:hypothetical protein
MGVFLQLITLHARKGSFLKKLTSRLIDVKQKPASVRVADWCLSASIRCGSGGTFHK